MIIVFGSLNMDVNMSLPVFPVTGDMMLASDYNLTPGGKGANQALAAARAGGDVAMVGMVGDDSFGTRLKKALKKESVRVSGVGVSSAAPTGCAVVSSVPDGENQVVIALGANMETSNEQVPDEVLTESGVLLMQMEVKPEENIKLMKRAKKRGVCNILNLAPSIIIPQKAISLLDYLIVNKNEAKQIAQVTGVKGADNACSLARAIAQKCELTCIITLGPKGAVVVTQEGEGWGIPPLPVEDMDNMEVVDIAGASDAFCGTFAAGIHQKLNYIDALKRASVASALACTRKGTQPSFPYIGEIEDYLPLLPEVKQAHTDLQW